MVKPKHKKKKMKWKDLPTNWYRIAKCESGLNLHITSPSGTYYGAFQIHRGWFKGKDLKPRKTDLRQQYKLAKYIKGIQGWGAWTCARIVGII